MGRVPPPLPMHPCLATPKNCIRFDPEVDPGGVRSLPATPRAGQRAPQAGHCFVWRAPYPRGGGGGQRQKNPPLIHFTFCLGLPRPQTTPPPPPSRVPYTLCPATVPPKRQVPGSAAFVTDSTRPQPLWQPPPTACLTAFEAPSLLMHPPPPPLMDPECFGRRNPPPMEKQKRRTKTAALVDLRSGKGKGRAAHGNRPMGAAGCRREQQIQGNPPPPHGGSISNGLVAGLWDGGPASLRPVLDVPGIGPPPPSAPPPPPPAPPSVSSPSHTVCPAPCAAGPSSAGGPAAARGDDDVHMMTMLGHRSDEDTMMMDTMRGGVGLGAGLLLRTRHHCGGGGVRPPPPPRASYRRGGNLAGAKFGTAKCGTAKLYHILPWYLRTEATFLPLPNLCAFSLHYKVPNV